MTSRGHLGLAVGLATLYAVCYSAIKQGLTYAPPLTFAGLRALLAGAGLLAVLVVRKRRLTPPRRLWPGLVAVAATGTFLAYGAMFLSPGHTGAGIASVLGNTTPLITFALAVPLLGERMTRAKVGAVVPGLAGVSLIAYPAISDPAHAGVLGALLPLGAATGFAVSSVLVKRMKLGDAVLEVAAWQLLLGGGALLATAALVEPGARVRWAPAFIALLAFLALLGTALTTVVWYWLVQRDEVGRLTVALFFAPVVGLGLGVALFGERLGVAEFAGTALIVTGLAAVVFEAPGRSRRLRERASR